MTDEPIETGEEQRQIETGEEQRQRVAENLRRLKAANSPREDIDAYLKSERKSPVMTRDVNDRVGAFAGMAADAAGFGLPGLVEDIATSTSLNPKTAWSQFQQSRDLRAEGKRDLATMPDMPLPLPNGMMLNVSPSTVATVGGSLLNPFGRLTKTAKAGAGVIRQALAMGKEGSMQAALQALGQYAGTTNDVTGLGHAIPAAVMGGGVGTVMGGVQGTIPLLRSVKDAVQGKNLGDRAHEIADDIAARSGPAFARVGAQAKAIGTTPEIDAALTSKTIKPFGDRIKTAEATESLSPAEQLLEARKLMTRVQKKVANQQEGTAEHLADAELLNRSIGSAKGRLDAAANQSGITELESAVLGHRTMKQEQQAFERGSDMAERIILGKDVAGKKLLLNSPAAWERQIAGYTPAEAARALQGVQGRLKEVPELTSNPVGKFGIVSSTAKAILAPTRMQKYIDLLMQKAGTAPPPPSGLLEYLSQVTGRVAGSQP